MKYFDTARLDTDARGRLFDPRVRRMVDSDSTRASLDRGAMEALAAFRMAGHYMMQLSNRWAEKHGLSDGRMQVLFVLRGSPEQRLPLGEIAEALGVSPRNVTGLVDLLERDGLIRRVPDLNDRRSIQAQLTQHGIQKVEDMWDHSVDRRARIVSGFTESDLADLRHLCLRLAQNVSTLVSSPKEVS